mmetsp:Transcript_15795/g.27507  ORF Transcript_15795/g.27507 Transcript_15795/m.27507 type:complete len:336 (+) Transcript_15795:579-1586(+)
MSSQQKRFRILGVEFFLDFLSPQFSCGSHLCNLGVKVESNAPKEGESWSHRVYIQFGDLDGSTNVLQTVRNGKCHFNGGIGPSLLHMISRNGDGIEFGHVLGGVTHDICHDTIDGRFRRINVRVSNHELLKNIVLYGSLQVCHDFAWILVGVLFQCRLDIKRHDWQNRSVHGHTDRDLRQIDSVKKNFHVFERVDRYTGHTDISNHTVMVRVVTSVSGQIKRHTETLLSRSQVSFVKGITFFCGRKAGILTNGPRAVRVHGSVRATSKGKDTWHVGILLIVQIPVNWLNGNTFGGHTVSTESIDRDILGSGKFLVSEFFPLLDRRREGGQKSRRL